MKRDLALGAAAALAIAVLYLVAAPASRSAVQPAPVAQAAVGFEQGKLDPAAGPRTGAPATRGPVVSRGTASWYAADGLIAAAGPELRHALGSDWRGSVVRVVAGDRSVSVKVTDWCQCYKGERRERLIDLSAGAFAELAPLAVGLVDVGIQLAPGRPVPPATDAR